eukprot:TRINITY_DN13432_c0_g1_i1.p1 TRINITY_DN13432_c0_g1~~TRINITY_DN13432_c0_g1_i1.p1  ORF type:complete len:339 (+),score=45.37 TRINITY_DN13432_c0_g1_i1:59-1075(+)
MGITITESQILQGVGGGILIAVSSSLNFVLKGRITGISGAVNSIINRYDSGGGLMWKESFMTGLMAMPVMAKMLLNGSNGTTIGDVPVTIFDSEGIQPTTNTLLVLGGALVGIGTKMGSGCTSGHGACGLPRLSARSWAATLTFCATGILTATLGLSEKVPDLGIPSLPSSVDTTLVMPPIIAFWAYRVFFNSGSVSDSVFSFITGALFGMGLLFSGMCRPSKVIGFLTFTAEKFDPQLVFVLGTAVLINLVTFNWATSKSSPLLAATWSLPTAKDVDAKLLTGAALFGIGWGLCGICPGPGFMSALGSRTIPLWAAAVVAGQLAYGVVAPNAVVKRE